MSRAIRIRDARAADGAGEYQRLSLGIRDGRIVHAAPEPPAGEWDHDIDAGGLLLLPGWIELAARLREPGATRKADIASELAAAGISVIYEPGGQRPQATQSFNFGGFRGRGFSAPTPAATSATLACRIFIWLARPSLVRAASPWAVAVFSMMSA